jgi:hypothetical protein
VIDAGLIDAIPNTKDAARVDSSNVENQTDRRPEIIHNLGISSVKVERG